MQVTIEYQFNTIFGRRRGEKVINGKSVDDATKKLLNLPKDKDNRDGKIYIISAGEEL